MAGRSPYAGRKSRAGAGASFNGAPTEHADVVGGELRAGKLNGGRLDGK